MLTTDDGVAATTGEGSSPIDLALSRNGKMMFALSAKNGAILSYRVFANNILVPRPSIADLPTTVNGLATF